MLEKAQKTWIVVDNTVAVPPRGVYSNVHTKLPTLTWRRGPNNTGIYTLRDMLCCNSCIIIIMSHFLCQRWYISGGVECFTGWHIPLAVLAVAVLALCVGLVPLAICAALNKVKFNDRSTFELCYAVTA